MKEGNSKVEGYIEMPIPKTHHRIIRTHPLLHTTMHSLPRPTQNLLDHRRQIPRIRCLLLLRLRLLGLRHRFRLRLGEG